MREVGSNEGEGTVVKSGNVRCFCFCFCFSVGGGCRGSFETRRWVCHRALIGQFGMGLLEFRVPGGADAVGELGRTQARLYGSSPRQEDDWPLVEYKYRSTSKRSFGTPKSRSAPYEVARTRVIDPPRPGPSAC